MFYENQVTLAEESAEPPGTSLLGRSARTTVLSGNGRSERAALLGREDRAAVAHRPNYGKPMQDAPGDTRGSYIGTLTLSWPHSSSLHVLGTWSPSYLGQWNMRRREMSEAVLRAAVEMTRPHLMAELQGGWSLGPPVEDTS